jgi:hypothetical protein
VTAKTPLGSSRDRYGPPGEGGRHRSGGAVDPGAFFDTLASLCGPPLADGLAMMRVTKAD